MAYLRRDIVTKREVLISPDRAKRPSDFSGHSKVDDEYSNSEYNKDCPFCVGNEESTPYEIYTQGTPWNIRVIPNKYPIVDENGESYGKHCVVIESTKHNKKLHELSDDEIKELLNAYIYTSKKFYESENIKYIQIFKNYKKAGGASLEHPHSQIIGLDFVPKRVTEEIENCKEYFLENGKCIFCSIIDNERKEAKRIIYENESYIAFCPYASFFPYEVQILSKNHKSSILSLNNDEIVKLGDIIKKVHFKYNENIGDIPYNMYFHFVKDELEYYHFYIKICPRISMHAGLELSTDIMVSAISPEYAAEVLNRI